MAGWTQQDWSDLGSAALLLAGFALAVTLVQYIVRRMRGEVFWQAKDRRELMFWLFIGALMSSDSLGAILERRGIPDWTLWIGLALLFIVGLISLVKGEVAIREGNRVQAVTNPASDGRREICKVDLAPEDRKIMRRTNGAALGLAALAIGAVVLTIWQVQSAGVAGLIALLAVTLAMIGGLAWLVSGRWPIPLSMTGAVEIDATPEAVWEMCHYRDTSDYYRSIVRRVERLSGPAETYCIHYYNSDLCTDCGLHKDPAAQGRSCMIEVEAAEWPRRLVFRAYPKLENGQADPMMDYEWTEMLFEALPGGQCRVTNRNRVEKPRPWLAALLKLGDPIGEHLRDLKAHAEGAQGDTIYDRAEREIDCARHVPRHCGCPPKGAAALAT